MKIATKCIPVGMLPYTSLKHAVAMVAKLYQTFPFIALLPNISSTDNLQNLTFENMPGIVFQNNKIEFHTGTSKYEKLMSDLNKAYNSPSLETLEAFSFNSVFLEKYFQMIKKFKSPNACINILGPFTVSQLLTAAAKEQILADKSYRKLFIQSICVKTLWVIEKIKQCCPDTVPVVILEEPMLYQLGVIKRENSDITSELVTVMLSQVVEKLKKYGAIVGIQCMEKCDWSIPIKSGVDLISYDAYNNPNNLGIIPDILTEFLRRGGMINWGIVPTLSDNMIKELGTDYLHKRLLTTFDGIILSGVPADLIYKSALVSLNGDTNHLSVMFAEKASMLATQLCSRLTARI